MGRWHRVATYAEFLESKASRPQAAGREPGRIHDALFPFQRDLVRWAVRKGRCALFADTGLGKTLMQCEWARQLGERTLILAPLSVGSQTVAIARSLLGIEVWQGRRQEDAGPGITITNYEMLDRFDPSAFGAVVLDESSILKALDGKTRQRLTAAFADTPFRLCCTATPAPNDIAEIASHAEFLGVSTRANMLARYFVHDSDQSWRLKGHAQDAFFSWLASWGMSVRKPSDLGYADDGYDLPPLAVIPEFVDAGFVPSGQLMWLGLKGIQERATVRKGTLGPRVSRAAEIINGDGEQWIAWCGLNDEGRVLKAAVRDSILVEGDQSPEDKAAAIEAFQRGEYRVLITKPRIAGLGLNLQNAHRMVFVGLSDSWESYYQCIRRCYRFGQRMPVEAHIVLADAEEEIFANVMRKEREAADMADKLIANVREFERAEISGAQATGEERESTEASGEGWRLLLGDAVERMAELDDDSIDLSVFSPPFMSLYTYSPSARDLGNSQSPEEFFAHFGFIIEQLLRVTRPGRNACVHVAQVPSTLVSDGVIGLKDFRGQVIGEFERHGWTYHGEVCIDKDPQAQAIRTHAKGLLFTQLRRDASWMRPALADYILVFRKPGDNAVPVRPNITNDEWIEWARPVWYGIKETDTLNVQQAKDDRDERHICPLQLGTIERCIRLWSNKGETVLSPFAGIGSEGYVALKHGRQFVGVELKRGYWDVARRNLESVRRTRQQSLFANAEATSL